MKKIKYITDEELFNIICESELINSSDRRYYDIANYLGTDKHYVYILKENDEKTD